MRDDKIVELLERITLSLEKIADSISKLSSNNQCKQESMEDKVAIFSNNRQNKISINDISEIEKFLNSKGISIKTIKKEDEADEVLDNIALYMGNKYTAIKKLYRYIKKNLNSGKTFKLDLKSATQEEISSVTQLCTNLHQIAFLDEYKYFKSPKYYLYAKVNPIPKALNFFSGGWLERYIKTAVEQAIKSTANKIKLNYSYIKNPQIILPNGNDFELDIIYQIEDEIFWFEAKTGDYQRYVQKYSNVANILKLDENNCFMVLTDISETSAKALKSIFKMNVIGIENFSDIFSERIYKKISDLKN